MGVSARARHEPKMPSLHEALAQDPSFFVDVVSAICRRHSDPPGEATPEQQRVASNAWHLLSSWKRVPGTDHTGAIDGAALKAWSHAVMPLLAEADRRAVGEIQFGKVLAFSPAAADGSWPCVEVRDLLESLQSEKVEEGLRVQIFNNRGVTSRNPEDGGDQERALAKKYRDAAAGFQRPVAPNGFDSSRARGWLRRRCTAPRRGGRASSEGPRLVDIVVRRTGLEARSPGGRGAGGSRYDGGGGRR